MNCAKGECLAWIKREEVTIQEREKITDIHIHACCLDFHPTQPLLALGTPTGLTIYNYYSSTLEEIPISGGVAVERLKYTQDGQYIGVYTRDHVFIVAHADTYFVLNSQKMYGTNIDIANNLTYAASTMLGSVFTVGNLLTGNKIELNQHTPFGVVFSLSPDGQHIAVGRDGMVNIFDTVTGKRIHALAPPGSLSGIARVIYGVTPRYLFASTYDKELYVWEDYNLIGGCSISSPYFCVNEMEEVFTDKKELVPCFSFQSCLLSSSGTFYNFVYRSPLRDPRIVNSIKRFLTS